MHAAVNTKAIAQTLHIAALGRAAIAAYATARPSHATVQCLRSLDFIILAPVTVNNGIFTNL